MLPVRRRNSTITELMFPGGAKTISVLALLLCIAAVCGCGPGATPQAGKEKQETPRASDAQRPAPQSGDAAVPQAGETEPSTPRGDSATPQASETERAASQAGATEQAPPQTGDSAASQAGATEQATPQGSDSGPVWAFGGPLPSAVPLGAELVAKLDAAWEGRPQGYKPRTRHLRPDGSPKYTNRLFLETSPYLGQHAHNPVNWFPWGDEAFELARKLNRPVLLSVGYSTCHWCHVMEEESFEDEEIAGVMNQSYVAIKVDREERPDVDSIYMAAVQALTGRGGWPMTVWLNPEREPFYGGTYFPARDGDRGARAGFLTLLRNIRTVYEERPEAIFEQTNQLVRSIESSLTPAVGGIPGTPVIQKGAQSFRDRFDSTWGGRQGRPKFPSSMPVQFLLRYYRRTGDEQYLSMAVLTLEKMAAGGMYDHVGGGFHRYSTDQRWLVPHFEKMLYDNALLARAYLDGHQVTGREDFARVVREILRYVQRDMTSPDGAFYSATDADSLNPEGHAEEGWFFTWTPAEIEAVLGQDRARVVAAYYGVTSAGNLEGRNILNTPKPDAEVAASLEISVDELRSIIEQSKDLLYAARKKRPAPLRDEKILTAWNGLMISAYAQAGLVLGEADYVRMAQRAANSVLTHLRRDGRLYRSFKDGRPRHNAYLDDYAFLIAGLLDLYEATGEIRWLRESIALDDVLAKHYEDRQAGGFFLTSDDHEELLAREKPSRDGAVPSGNSIHALNLLRLQEFTTNDRYRQRAEKAMQAVGQILNSAPAALSEMLLAVDFLLDRPKEVIIVTPGSRREAEPLLSRMRKVFLPNRILVVAVEGQDLQAQQKLVPLVENKVARNARATAYVCEEGFCKLPTSDPAVFEKQLSAVEPLEETSLASSPSE